MIYNLANTRDIGKRVRVFDANGLEWKYCLECDTETGRILKFKTDRNENPIVNSTGDVLLKEEIYASAPLTVVPIEGEVDAC